MLTIDKAEIQARKDKLDACGHYLKQEFIGIDTIIDSILEYLQVWYLMPEILNRPVIINLWGMTGVGKTDLVRKIVKFLDFQDRFAEVELSNSDSSHWISSVSKILDNHNLNDGQPAIVLFDEIQRFNTLDTEGIPLERTKFSDFWELLSDGRLSRKTKEDLDTFLFDFLTKKRNRAKQKAKGEEVDEEDSLGSWEAMSFQSSLGLNLTVEQLAEISEQEMVDIIMAAKQEKKIYEPVDHSKTLIIVSGNLDEAFQMAAQTSEADVDADIYHAFTKKITMVDIKNALARKFRPEQVARFGNIHLIYRALRRRDFERLIEKEIARITKSMLQKVGITLTVAPEINKLIYRNGVFPVQGVRPVFSSVIDILESNLSNFMFEAIMDSASTLDIDYDKDAKKIIARFSDKTVEVPYEGRIDKIRQANQIDNVANISVHECGHAVVYMALTGMVPLQLKSKVASSYAGGFTFPHQLFQTRASILNKIKIYLAGGIAEELIFGVDNASTGRINDRMEATSQAIEFIRKYGFDADYQAVYNLDAPYLKMKATVTDERIEQLMAGLVDETRELLGEHLPLLRAMSLELRDKGSLESAEIVEIGSAHGLEAKVMEEGYMDIVGYNEMLEGAHPA